MAGLPPTFITVKYGDNQDALFNPWCPTHVLLTYIRKACECEEESVIDLVNTEGDLQNLPARLHDYAHRLLDCQKTYILVRIIRSENNSIPQYTSQLNDLELLYPEVNEKLISMNTPAKLRRKDSKWNVLRHRQNAGSRRLNAGSSRTPRSGKSLSST